MNIRQKNFQSKLDYYVSPEVLNINVNADHFVIFQNLEEILYADVAANSTKSINNIFNENAVKNFWGKKTVILLKYLNKLQEEKRINSSAISELVKSLQRFINSKDYEASYKTLKSSWLGFSLVQSDEAFKDLNSQLDGFAKSLKLEQTERDIFRLSSLLSAVREGLNFIIKNPSQAILFAGFYNLLLVEAQARPAPKPVAIYNFDNANALDSSGNGNDGVVVGVVTEADRWGRADSAMRFDGKSYITGPAFGLPSDERTVSFWFKPDIVPSFPTAGFDRGGFALGYGGGVCGTSFIFIINYSGVSTTPSYDIQGHCAAHEINYLDSSMTDSPSIWNHFALTSKYGVGTNIYLNGVNVAFNQSIYFSNTDVVNKIFAIGTGVNADGLSIWNSYNSPPAFQGVLDDIIFFKVALEEGQILDIFTTPQPEAAVSPTNPDSDSSSSVPGLWKQIGIGAGVGAIGGLVSGLLTFSCIFSTRKCAQKVDEVLSKHYEHRRNVV
jgi:hypothetical protein